MYKEGKIPASMMLKSAAFKEAFEKQASPDISTFLRYLATGLAVSTGLGVAAGVANLGVKAYEESQLESQKDDMFKEVLKLHPDLQGNKERAKLYFESLIHFSPVIAKNPLTAGAYIKQALQYDHVAGGPLPASINELTNIQKSTMDSRKNAPKSTLGTIVSGFGEAPAKSVPSFMSYNDFAN
jgi:hypothetical protein